eukprot:CAMPEP_0183344130 /NCGR_PEP_ID=MMETSP0164_2-20130417/9885_1 /TAXON_ID=221442 /ORGANISM="Coccolithus pelagicus ssp braarudi, Strain PLY182g" /LENGTH=290 /DNA_ID=CAMNT_0025515087 /DNA_START=15 /DNA_END=887 /DNA_ORIENTATION=+
MAEEEYDEATPEQKRTIAAYFINSAPTGEVEEVVKDVKTLVGSSAVLGDAELKGMLHTYNTQHFVSAKAPDGTTVVVSPFGEVDPETYLDAATGKVLKFDHLKSEFVSETEHKQVLADDIAAMRGAIDQAVGGYMKTMYKNSDRANAALAVYGTDDKKVTVVISAKNARLSSFWAGGWQSTYALDVSKKGEVEMKGTIKVNVHYFEDGNVQLHTSLAKEAKVEVSDPAGTAKSVALAIERIESEFQSSLEELYVDMHSNTFKAMRRFLPLNRQKMNWTTSAHSLASEITK